MPVEIWYLVLVFGITIIGISVLKRPLYESMFYAFAALVAVTNTWMNVGSYILDALMEPSLYVIFVFIVSASLLSKTSVIDDCIAIILSIFGRLRGGAGFVAIIGSTYMGSLSGSGPGNVATTGVFTIPAMIRSGYPRHLAANVEAHASTMGNMIPPAGMIGIAFALLDSLYPGAYTFSQYWVLLWGVAIWFIAQRIILLYLMCRYYKVEAMRREDIPSLRQSLKNGWKAIFLPIIVALPFTLTSECADFFTARLGAGASSLNSSLLLFLPSLIVVFSVLMSDKKTLEKFSVQSIYDDIRKNMNKVVSPTALVLFAYFISNAFADLNVEMAIGQYIQSFNMSKFALCLILPLFTAMLGMLLPGSTQIKIFGGVIISVMAAAGGNPMLAAAMLPCICGAMYGVTPPSCACVYTAMGIADAELKPTMTNCMIWVTAHYLLSVGIMMGLLPVFGLIG